MTIFSKFVTTTATLLALGAPAMAVDLQTSAGLGAGITLHHNQSKIDSGTATFDVGAAVTRGTSDFGTPVDPGFDASRFIGDMVIARDGRNIGTISKAYINADGSTAIVVELAEEIPTQARQFTLDVAAAVTPDGDLVLGWTQPELIANLDARFAAGSLD